MVVDVGLGAPPPFGYWTGGLGERSGAVGAALGRLRQTGVGRRPLTMSLGDERVMVARRAVAVPAAPPAVAGPAAATG